MKTETRTLLAGELEKIRDSLHGVWIELVRHIPDAEGLQVTSKQLYASLSGMLAKVNDLPCEDDSQEVQAERAEKEVSF